MIPDLTVNSRKITNLVFITSDTRVDKCFILDTWHAVVPDLCFPFLIHLNHVLWTCNRLFILHDSWIFTCKGLLTHKNCRATCMEPPAHYLMCILGDPSLSEAPQTSPKLVCQHFLTPSSWPPLHVMFRIRVLPPPWRLSKINYKQLLYIYLVVL